MKTWQIILLALIAVVVTVSVITVLWFVLVYPAWSNPCISYPGTGYGPVCP